MEYHAEEMADDIIMDQIIPLRTCWQWGRYCASCNQHCNGRFKLSMPLTNMCRVHDITLGKSGMIYRNEYGRVECDEEHISKSARSFGERHIEHLRAPSPIHD